MNHTVASPTVWEAWAHIALILGLVAPAVFYGVAGILTCPDDKGDDTDA